MAGNFLIKICNFVKNIISNYLSDFNLFTVLQIIALGISTPAKKRHPPIRSGTKSSQDY
jgi:hypothetical protein